MTKLPTKNCVAAVALSLLAPISASAEGPLQLTLSGASTYDSNVASLPSSTDPKTILGGTDLADTIKQASAGANLLLPLGRQRFAFGADISRYFFEQYTSLNHTDAHAAADWRWEIGSWVRGSLSHSRDRQQTSFAYNQGGSPDTRNLSATQFQMEIKPLPDWRAIGELGYFEENHAIPALQVYDRDTTSGSLELRYETPLGNALGTRLKLGRYHLPNPQQIAAASIDNSYHDSAVSAFYQAQFTAASQTWLEGGFQKITHAKNASQDFSGWTARATYRWTIPITSFALDTWRNVDTLSNEAASFVVEKGVSFEPHWALTRKIGTELKLARLWRQRAGGASLNMGLRQDTANSAKFGLRYDPSDVIRLALVLESEQLKSNDPNAEFNDKKLSLQLRAQF